VKGSIRAIAIILTVSAIGSGIFYLLNRSNRRAVEARTIELAISEGKTIEKVLSRAATQLLVQGEAPLMRFMDELFANDQVIYVAVKRSGRLIHAASKYEGYLPLAGTPRSVVTFDSPLGKIIEVTALIAAPAGASYTSHIGYYFSALDEIRRASGRSLLLLTLLQAAIILSLASLLYGFNRQMGRKELEVQHEKEERQRLQEVSLITAGINHEIRNPLNSLYLSYQMLEPRLDPADAEAAFHGRALKKEIKRIQEIIERFSNLNSALPVRPEPIDLKEFLSDLTSSWSGPPGGPEIVIDAKAGSHVVSDRSLLARVVDNIVRNAAEAGARRIAIQAKVQADGALIAIQDDGPGIKAAHLPFIFDPFVSFRSPGSGIGLALAKRIVSQLGGRIEAKSVEGAGAEFRIHL
jgi:signal transduction histidine kinase